MKTNLISTLLLLFTLCITHTVTAQQAQTLFDGDVTHGGFGGPAIKFDQINGDLGVWVGGRGGWIINFDEFHAISLGGGGFGLVTEHRAPDPDYGEAGTDYFALNGYGGFIMEYTNSSYRLVHPTISALIGAGGLMIRDRDYDHIESLNTSPDQYFVFEPSASLEVNVTNYFRMAAGVSYRLTSGIERAGFRDSDFSGLNGVITLKFGKFI